MTTKFLNLYHYRVESFNDLNGYDIVSQGGCFKDKTLSPNLSGPLATVPLCGSSAAEVHPCCMRPKMEMIGNDPKK